MIWFDPPIIVPTAPTVLSSLNNDRIVAARRVLVRLPHSHETSVYALGDGLTIQDIACAVNKTWRRGKRRGHFLWHGFDPETGQLVRGPSVSAGNGHAIHRPPSGDAFHNVSA